MGYRQFLIGAAALWLAASLPAKKKNPDDVTQTLSTPKEPPMVAIGEIDAVLRKVRSDCE